MVIIIGMHPQNIITTIAGTGAQGSSGDGGAATFAQLFSPVDVSVDISGNVYFVDGGNSEIRMVTRTGIITTIASAGLDHPHAVSVDISGNVYIADTWNNKVRMVTKTGIFTTFAGTGTWGSSGDGGAATSAQLADPTGVAVDISGNVYIADHGNQKIRMVSSNGIVTTIAGSGAWGSYGDNGAATSAQLYYPYGVSVDISGNVYIADSFNNKIRMVTSTGIITTIAGTGTQGSYGDNGAATSAQLYQPYGISVDISGNVYIADYAQRSRIRMVTKAGIITTYAGTGTPGDGGDGGPATSAQVYGPEGVAVDISGNVYIADTFNNKIRKVVPPGRVVSLPTGQPSMQPSKQPSSRPTKQLQRISIPTGQPSHSPSRQPSRQPTSRPTTQLQRISPPTATPTQVICLSLLISNLRIMYLHYFCLIFQI